MATRPKLDKNIAPLVKEINAFPGLLTIGSCGGHRRPRLGQWDEGTWYVTFSAARTAAAHASLEFLAWLVNNDAQQANTPVTLYPFAYPPHLNEPGHMLRYHLEGYKKHDPVEFADYMRFARTLFFIEPRDARRHADRTQEQKARWLNVRAEGGRPSRKVSTAGRKRPR